MIDLHCHILPGLDDGPANYEQALAMARLAAADQISTIVATPHLSYSALPFLHERRQERLAILNRQLVEQAIPVTVVSGAEVAAGLPPAQLGEYTLNKSNYLLLEFPHTHLPLETRKILFTLQSNGYRVIIAHPERNPSVLKNPASLLDLLSEGIYVQITAASLSGDFGWSVQRCTKNLLRQGAVHFLASDGHSADKRKPLLSKAAEKAAKIVGAENARRLVYDNPAAVLAGRALPT